MYMSVTAFFGLIGPDNGYKSYVGWPEPYIYSENTDFFGREITKYTVIYGVYIQSWPTFIICVHTKMQNYPLFCRLIHQGRYSHSHTRTNAHKHAYTHTHTQHTHTHACVHIPTPKHTQHAQTGICVHTLYTHSRTSTHSHTHSHTHTYTNTHTHTHTFTHIQFLEAENQGTGPAASQDPGQRFKIMKRLSDIHLETVGVLDKVQRGKHLLSFYTAADHTYISLHGCCV